MPVPSNRNGATKGFSWALRDGAGFLLMRSETPVRCANAMTSTGRKLMLDERRDKARNRRPEAGRPAYQMDGGEVGLALGGQIVLDPRAYGFACETDIQYSHHRNARTDDHAIPVIDGTVIRRRQPGFFLDFTRHAAGNIDRAVAQIVEIGRSGRKINPPGIGGMLTHFTHHEGAVGATQRAHAKTIERGSL